LNIIVTEETEHGDMPIDIYSKLAKDRIIFLHDEINDELVTDVIATLMLKDVEDPDSKISIFINSESADLRSVFMLYDTMNILQSPIETICAGSAANEVVLLLAAGTPGMRYATANSLINPSQHIASGMGIFDLSDAYLHMDRIKRNNKQFMTALAKCVKKPYKTVMKDFEKPQFFSARQAMKYGFIDGIINKSEVVDEQE
jgi:ATP-dependent Clp protease protease subunit